MRNTKKSVLAFALTAALVLTALVSMFTASAATYSFTERTDKGYEVVSGVDYSEYTLTSGVNDHVETASALEFSSDNYIPMVFSCFAGTSGVLATQYKYAVQKYGYEVAGIINGSFFSMDTAGTGSYGTLVGIDISNGKIASAHAGYSGEVIAFTSDGQFQAVNSSISYTLTIDGQDVPNGLYYINKTSGTKSTATWSNKFYYYDVSCGRVSDTSEFAKGYEVLCKKVDNTELVVGGTLKGEVISVTPDTYGGALAEDYYDMSDKFILFVKSDSSYASYVTGLAAGDEIDITATETIAESKEVMENASSVISNVGWLVKDGVDQTQIYSTIGTHSVTLCARWTAFGIKADGSYVFFTTEGSTTGDTSRAVTLKDVAKAMMDMGCVNVIRMDGGGSVAMYVSNDGTGAEGYKTVSTRAVGDCILIVKRPAASSVAQTVLDTLIVQAENALGNAEDETLREAYNEGVAIRNAATSTSGDFTRAIMKLQEAFSGSSKLIDAIDDAKSIKYSDYSSDELEAIWAAYQNALAVKNNENATNSEIKDAADALDAAVNINRNVALGKSYTCAGVYPTYATASWPDEGSCSLTDGKDATTASYGDSAWVGFNIGADDIKNNNPKLSSIVVNLADTYNINKFALRVYDGHGDAGISAPSAVTFYYSADGTTWTSAGSGALENTTTAASVNAYVLSLTSAVNAKFVKAEMTHASNWAFISEFEAYKASTAVSNVGWVSSFNQQITAGAASIFTPDATPELTYEAANVKWTENLYLAWDDAKGGFKVTKIEGPNGQNGGTIAQGSIVIAVHSSEVAGDTDGSGANRTYAATAKVGDYIEFHGIYVNGQTILPGGYFAIVSAANYNANYSGIYTDPNARPAEPDISDYVTSGLTALYTADYHSNDGKTWYDASGSMTDIDLSAYDAANNYFNDAKGVFVNKATKVYFDTKLAELISTGKFTTEMVIKNTEVLGTSFCTYLNSTNDSYALFMRLSNPVYAEFKCGSNVRPKVAVTDKSYFANSTVTITFDAAAGTCCMYVNGVLLQSQVPTSAFSIADFYFGMNDPAKSHNTEYAEFRFYDRALNADEVAANYAADTSVEADLSTLWDVFGEDEFTEVNSGNGVFQNGLGTDTAFKFQSASDSEYVYFAVVVPTSPVGTAESYGNGNGTDVRVWFKTNDAATVYTHFFDIAYDGDNTPVIIAKKNGSLTENSGAVVIDTTGTVAEGVAGSGYWLAQFKIPLSVIEAQSDFGYYIQVWDAAVGDCLLYPAACPANLDSSDLKNFYPYRGWTDSAINIEVEQVPEESSEEPSEESSAEVSEETSEPAETSAEQSVENSVQESSETEPPYTGDSGLIAIAILSIIALAGVVAIKRR